MRFGSELRRKAEQIFVIPTCAWAVLSAVIQAGVMGVCGAGRHGATPPWKGSKKTKRSEVRKTILSFHNGCSDL